MRLRARRSALAFAACIVAAAALAGGLPPTAVAQGEPLAVTLAHDAPGQAKPGSALPFTLTIEADVADAVCPQGAEIPVTFSVASGNAPDGVLLDGLHANASLAIPAGAHTRAAPTRVSTDVPLMLLVARYVSGGVATAFEVTVTATPTRESCVAPPGALEGTASIEIAVEIERLPEGDPAFHPEHEIHGGAAFEKYLAPGERFTWTFDAPGRYGYHDHLDPERKGLVRVLAIAEGTQPPTVRITAAGYEPADLAVKKGATVTWVNEDAQTRTVSADEAHDARVVTEPEDAEAALRSNPGAGDEDGNAEAPASGVALLVAGFFFLAIVGARRRAGKR